MTVWRVVITVVFFTVAGALTAKADITGSSAITLLAEPIPCTLVNEIKLDTPCEKTLLKFDIEALIKFGLSVSGLLFTTDIAVGIPGLEHAIFNIHASLGMVDILAEMWLATPFESVTDVNNLPNIVVIPPGGMLFVKERITTSLTLGGLQVKNLAIFEDVTFPNPNSPYGEADCDGDGEPEGTCIGGIETNPATHYQTQSFAFGDLITIAGATPSGITIVGQLGICATNAGNAVKKFSASGSVNPDCVGKVKPQLFFDFETISISGIPLASGLLGSTTIRCTGITACQLTNTFNFTGGPIPFSTSVVFTNLFSVSFGGLNVVLSSGDLVINVNIDSSFGLNSASIRLARAIVAGNLTAQATANLSFQKGQGITGATFSLAVTTGVLNANQALALVRSATAGRLEFGSLSMSMGITIAPAQTSIQVVFGKAGLTRAGFSVGLVY